MLLVAESVSDCEGDPVALAVRERLFVTDGVVDAEKESDWLGVVVMLLVADCVSDCEVDPVVLAVRERLFVTDGVKDSDCEGDVVRDIAWDDVEDIDDERDGGRTMLRTRLLEKSACEQCEEKQNEGNG